jgi:hypothetical protein
MKIQRTLLASAILSAYSSLAFGQAVVPSCGHRQPVRQHRQ